MEAQDIKKILDAAIEDLGVLIEGYAPEIKEAAENEGAFTLNLSVRATELSSPRANVDTGISFTKEKVKEIRSQVVDMHQTLFEAPKGN